MSAFRFQAVEASGAPVKGVIEAEDRKTALQLLGKRGLFPSLLESSEVSLRAGGSAAKAGETVLAVGEATKSWDANIRIGPRIRRKEMTAFTREMGTLLG